MQVTILTKTDCAFCDQAKDVVERLAAEYPLTVQTVDLMSPEGQALAQREGVLFPPGILLDGAAFGYGRLSERKLRSTLASHFGPAPISRGDGGR